MQLYSGVITASWRKYSVETFKTTPRFSDLLGIIIFASGAFGGYLLTGLMPMHAETWWLWPFVRVIWQVGGALWCGAAVSGQIGGNRFTGALLAGAIGLLLAINPALDLLRGPLQLDDAKILEAEINRGHLIRSRGARHKTIQGTLVIADNETRKWTINPLGMQANRMEKMLSECQQTTSVHIVFLQHLDVVLELNCQY